MGKAGYVASTSGRIFKEKSLADSNEPLGPRKGSSEEMLVPVQHICLFWEEA